MKNKILLFVLLVCGVRLQAQMHDANWPMGILDFPGHSGYGNVLLHFDSVGNPSWQTATLNMNFERTVAAMSDSTGHLLFYTNGCHIANAQGDTMPNGAGLNPGEVHDMLCGTAGYNVPNGAMSLAWPGRTNHYVLVHLGHQYTPNDGYRTGPLYYTEIDMSDATGEVVTKNNIIWDGAPESFTAIRHGNGRDWWLIVTESGTNKYRRYLFSPSGFEWVGTATIGPLGNCNRKGILAASPQGNRIVRTQSCKVIVLDFDRCNGAFSQPKTFALNATASNGGGAVFSADGNTLLYTAHLALLKADLTLSNPSLDTVVPLDSLVGLGMYLAARAPNGTVYFSRPHRSRIFPALHGLDSGDLIFERKGLLPPVHNVRSLPHLPNYRLYDLAGSVCDSLGIDTPVNSQTIVKGVTPRVRLYPNPATQTIAFDWEGDQKENLRYRIVHVSGQIIRNWQSIGPKNNDIIPIDQLPNATYLIQIMDENGNVFALPFIKV